MIKPRVPTPQEVLDARLPEDNDAGVTTVREYLAALLLLLWDQGEDMVKRPFGNSGWQYTLYKALIQAMLVDGSLDEDGYVEELETGDADELIRNAIIELTSA